MERNGNQSLSEAVAAIKPSTEDFDISLENGFSEMRQMFLSFCRENNYQFDTLQRAKHSSMMILYHFYTMSLSNGKATCRVCKRNTIEEQGQRREICLESVVCHACYESEGAVCHRHKLTEHSSMPNYAREREEPIQRIKMQERELSSVLAHASESNSTGSHPCSYPNCSIIKKLFYHARECKLRAHGRCQGCLKAWLLLITHSKKCSILDCRVPRCTDLRKNAKGIATKGSSN